MIEEVWKEVVGYEGKYQVSNHGRVRKYIYRKDVFVEFRIMKPLPVQSSKRPSKHKYMRVAFSGKYLMIHRLLMEAFVGPSNLQVDHIDGNGGNNHISNLEYVTPSENMRRARSSAEG